MPFELAPSLGDQVGEEAHGCPSLAAASEPSAGATVIRRTRSRVPGRAGPRAPPGRRSRLLLRRPSRRRGRRSSRCRRPRSTASPSRTESASAPTSGPVMVDTRRTEVITIRAAPASWTADKVSASGRSVVRRPRALMRSRSTSIPMTSRSPYRSINRRVSSRSSSAADPRTTRRAPASMTAAIWRSSTIAPAACTPSPRSAIARSASRFRRLAGEREIQVHHVHQSRPRRHARARRRDRIAAVRLEGNRALGGEACQPSTGDVDRGDHLERHVRNPIAARRCQAECRRGRCARRRRRGANAARR